MSDVNTRSTPLVPSRLPAPPPARGAARSGATFLARAFARHAVTLIAIALVFVVVALLDRTITAPSPNALPLWVIAFAGLGAAAVSTLLRRAGVRRRTPSPRRRAATPAERASHAPPTAERRSRARPREAHLVGGSRRSPLGTLAALGAALLTLGIVVRTPHAVPLLLGAGLTGMLAVRLIAGPPRGSARTAPRTIPPLGASASSAAATDTSRGAAPSAPRLPAVVRPRAAAPRASAGQRERARRFGRLGRPAHEVHAAREGAPGSGPPPRRPLRVRARATSEPRAAARA